MAKGKTGATKLRTVLPLGAVTLFSLLLFFWIAPIDDINPLRAVEFTGLVFVFWLIFVGLLLISIGILSMPEMQNTPARIAGFLFIAFGLIALVFAIVTMIDGNITTIMNDANLRFFTTILFGLTSVILLVDLIPRIGIGKGIVETVNA
jgi:hypothetical protein